MAASRKNTTAQSSRSKSRTSTSGAARSSSTGARGKNTSSSKAKKNTKTKSSSANTRKSGAKNKDELQQERRDSFRREIILWGLIAVSLLLFISNLGIGGVVGTAISSVLFGVFGLMAYLFPVVLLVGCVFYYVNRGNALATRILVATVLLVLFICMMLSLLAHGADALPPVQEYFYSVKNKFGGGLLGGALSWLMTNAFGLVGAYIIDIIGMIICLVLITGRSAMNGMARGGRKVVETAQDVQQERRSRRSRSLRMDHKVSGVTRDTRIIAEGTDNVEATLPEESSGRGNRRNHANAAAAQNDETGYGTRRKKSGSAKVADDTSNYLDSSSSQAGTGAANGQSQRTVSDRTLNYGGDGLQELYANPNVLSDELEEKLSHMESLEASRQKVSANRQETSVESRSSNSPDTSKAASSTRRKRSSALGAGKDSLQELTPDETYADDSFYADDTSYAGDSSYTDDAQADGMAARKRKSARSLVGAAAMAQEDTGMQAGNNDDLPSHDQTGMQADAQEYILPPTSLLAEPQEQGSGSNPNDLRETAQKLQTTLDTFGVKVAVTDISCGPTVTRYEIQPEAGVKVSRIVHLADDIKLNLAAADIRIEAPIPGKAAIGIEVPNKENVTVPFRELVESSEFRNAKSKISFAVGKDISGKPVVADIAKMPHVLIAGATGSGKSVCINTIIMSVLFHAKPDEVKMILIDPKVVELNVYRGIPHLMIDVVTDPKKAAAALNWAVEEMTERYQKFADVGARKLEEYNEKVDNITVPDGQDKPKKMCQILIVVDELADLMMVASREVEDAICRLAQLARAAGIHLVIATQRPSVNVITGLIKANMPSRIAFAVTSGVDSRTILDMNGAEKLLGKGDMLFYPQGLPKPIRVQGALVSDEEVSRVVAYIKEQNGPVQYSDAVQQKMSNYETGGGQSIAIHDVEPEDGRDAYFLDAARVVVDKEKASIGMFQRAFKIGFNRAARIMDQLEEAGIVGPEVGTKPRNVLMNAEELQEFIDEG